MGWSTSLAYKVSAGFAIGSVTVTSTIGHEFAKTYQEDFSSNNQQDFTVQFGASDRGKAAWQWVFESVDTCGKEETTLVREMAVTPNRLMQPCCMPGFALNARDGYNNCLEAQYVMPNVNVKRSGCTV